MVSCGYQDVVEMLLDFEVNVNVQDNIGRSLVNIAVENDYTGILQKLLTAKADPNLPDQQGFTPLCVAAGMGKVHQCQMLLSSSFVICLDPHLNLTVSWQFHNFHYDMPHTTASIHCYSANLDSL
jgi:ankyrin repeat protein